MGCSQSKANDVVIEPITAPPSECGKASMDLAFTEIIVDQETSASVPPPPVEEESSSSSEEEEVPSLEEEIVPTEEEIVAAEQEIEPVPVEVEMPAVEEPVTQAAEEPAVEEDDAPFEPEVEAEEEVELQEEKSAVVEKSAVMSMSAPVWTFTADKVAFTVGIAFFHILGSNGVDEDVHLTKRYSDFKLLHADMGKLMDREELPSMPGTSFLQGRNDKALLQERETVFVQMLNAIAVHPEGSQSEAFDAFLA